MSDTEKLLRELKLHSTKDVNDPTIPITTNKQVEMAPESTKLSEALPKPLSVVKNSVDVNPNAPVKGFTFDMNPNRSFGNDNAITIKPKDDKKQNSNKDKDKKYYKKKKKVWKKKYYQMLQENNNLNKSRAEETLNKKQKKKRKASKRDIAYNMIKEYNVSHPNDKIKTHLEFVNADTGKVMRGFRPVSQIYAELEKRGYKIE